MPADHLGETVWLAAMVAWYAIRFPFARRTRRVPVQKSHRSLADAAVLWLAFAGLFVIPLIWIVTGIPAAANYRQPISATILGTAIFGLALWVFWRAHKDLGRNWSITLEIRERHQLVSNGLYALIRHPMYASFLLMGLGQALLLRNWVAGLSGLIAGVLLVFKRWSGRST